MPVFDAQVVHWRQGVFAEQMAQRYNCVNVGAHAKPIIRTDSGRWLQRFVNLVDGNLFAADQRSIEHISSVISSHRSNVILAHFGHTGLYMLPVAKQLGIPIILHFHGTDVSTILTKNRWYRQSIRNCLKDFHACIVVGSHQRERLRSFGMPTQHVSLLPCGVPTELFTPATTRQRKLFRFAIVARLVKQKGVDISIKAFARAFDQGADAELVIVGAGPERPALESLVASLSLGEKVRFLGVMSERNVVEVLYDCDALLNHSVSINGSVEGFGVAVAEASACGLPVIVSACGGLIDQVNDGETGIIVPIGDVDTMAVAMRELALDRELARKYGQAGRRRMREQFDSRHLSSKLHSLLLEAISALDQKAALKRPVD